MVITYLRNANRQIIATLVALPNGNIGVAVRNSVDPVNKKLGLKIAYARAEKGLPVSERLLDDAVVPGLKERIEYLKFRASRYFKDQPAWQVTN